MRSPSSSIHRRLGGLYVSDTTNNRIRYIAGRPPTPSTTPTPSRSVTPGPQNAYLLPMPLGTFGTVSTVAGTGVAAYRAGDDGFPARWAQLGSPYGVAYDRAGQRLFVSQSDYNRIRVISLQTGLISTYAGTGTASTTNGDRRVATFYAPRGLAYDDATGSLFVAEFYGANIRVIFANGTTAFWAGTGGAGFADGNAGSSLCNNPVGVAMDPATGDVIFTDYR